jgi:polyferredoxin
MPHGRFWNALNLAGQLILLVAFAIAAIRLTGFFWPETALGARAEELFYQLVFAARVGPVSVSYYTVVDYFLSGVVGIGLFFHFSGRTWCRFFCPLAALMNIYARLGRFRIFSDKSKCISCNACTSQCHMGIDVMSFARRGEPMNDPQCVRCSACVSACPTGTLQFGRFTRDGFVALDQTPANALHLPKNSS